VDVYGILSGAIVIKQVVGIIILIKRVVVLLGVVGNHPVIVQKRVHAGFTPTNLLV